MTPRHPAPDPRLDPDPLTPHPFAGVVLGVAHRPCTACGRADRHPIHDYVAPSRRPAISRAVLGWLFAVLLVLLALLAAALLLGGGP